MRGHIRVRRGPRGTSYQLSVYAGRDADGRDRYVRETVRGSRRDAERRLAQLVPSVGTGERGPSPGVLLAELVDAWWDAATGQLSPHTCIGYRGMLERYVLPGVGLATFRGRGELGDGGRQSVSRRSDRRERCGRPEVVLEWGGAETCGVHRREDDPKVGGQPRTPVQQDDVATSQPAGVGERQTLLACLSRPVHFDVHAATGDGAAGERVDAPVRGTGQEWTAAEGRGDQIGRPTELVSLSIQRQARQIGVRHRVVFDRAAEFEYLTVEVGVSHGLGADQECGHGRLT